MDVAAFCIKMRLTLVVLILLVAQVHHSYFAQEADAAFPRIVPDRLQFFEYETVSVHCEENDGSTRWRVKVKLNKIPPTNSPNCDTSATSCTIYPTFERHSGEYWCEDEEGEKSDAVNISVTAGSLILESPAHPVLEGDDLILYCKNKKTQSQHIADFYRDGSHLGTAYTANMTIQNVSKSHEGLYKCSISGTGESPESWLKITKQTSDEKTTNSQQSPNSPNSPNSSPHFLTLLLIIVGILLVALLWLVVGLLLCRKHKVSGENTVEDPLYAEVSESNNVADPNMTYAVVKRKEKVSRSNNVTDPNMSYAVVKRKEKEPKVSKADTNPRLQEESVYSLLQGTDT